jgi:hypothetical protein
MNPETKARLTMVTPLSKYLAMALFVVMPFVGVYIGYTFAPEKVVEVERIISSGDDSVQDNNNFNTLFETSSSVPSFSLVEDGRLLSVESSRVKPNPVHIFLTDERGTRWISTEHGTCGLSDINLEETIKSRPPLEPYFGVSSEVVSRVSCWFGGSGSELYLFDNGNVVRMDIGECGKNPDCVPYSEPKLIF